MRRLGGKRWQTLHRLIYFSAVFGVIHYYWLVKSAVIKPLFYGAIVGLLLLWRFWNSISKKNQARSGDLSPRTASLSG